jgi:hypothetical protein
MKEEIISFTVAKLAKEKGFANKYPHRLRRDYYNHLGGLNGDVTEYIKAYLNGKDTGEYTTIDAPTQSLLQRWLREEKGVFISVDVNFCYDIYLNDEAYSESTEHNNYEQALEEGLYESLKLI